MRRTVSLDELDRFETDDSGQLYWRGNRIIVDQRVVLPSAVNFAVVVAGISAAVSAVFAALTYLVPACPAP